MMIAAEHYLAAERLLEQVETTGTGLAHYRLLLAQAQVHATLALAPPVTRDEAAAIAAGNRWD